jgi:hypothetical protein
MMGTQAKSQIPTPAEMALALKKRYQPQCNHEKHAETNRKCVHVFLCVPTDASWHRHDARLEHT